MRNDRQMGAMGSHGQNLLPWLPSQRWTSPTFGEFLERVEHEFGAAVDLAGLMMMGLGREERLDPDEIAALCGQLGVPAEDFGIGP